MQASWKTTLIVAGIALVAGVFLGTKLSCQTTRTTLPGAVQIPYHDTTITRDTISKTTTVTLTGGKEIDSVFTDRVKLIVVYDTVRSNVYPSVGPPATFSLPSLFERAAPTVIAAFKPQTPRDFIELYAHGAHNLLSGGYSGGVELDANLDQIHLINMTLFADFGYDQGLHVSVGGRGKLWGTW